MATASLTTSSVSLTVVWLCLTTVAIATGAELRTLRYNVSEETEAGSFIGDFKRDYYSAADRGHQTAGHDLGDLRFSFRSPSKYFRIDSVTGVIRTTRRIDREQLCARQTVTCDPYDQTLDVLVTPTQHFSLAKVRVTVIDVNDNAPAFPVGEMAMDVWDNSPPGALFSVPYAEDPDGGSFAVRNYSLVGGEGRFDLKVTDLFDGSFDVRIKLLSKLERDRQRTYNLTVIATDGGSPARSGSLLVGISVRGVAEVRPTFERETFTARVEENSPTGRWVTKVQATTSGGSQQPIVYSLVELPEVTDRRFPFRIDARTGSVYVSAPIDYERERHFRLTVAATSGGRPTISAHAQLVIDVTDVNDNAPEIAVNTLLRSGRGQVQENAPNGTFVAHVVITDVDSGENSWTACLTNSAIFLLVELSASEYKLTTAVTFDREDEIQHRVKVVCHDFGTPSLTSSVQLTIDVTDDNDNVPVFTRGDYSVVASEGLTHGSVIIRVSATDADDGPNAALSYALTSLDAPPCEVLTVDPLTGEIRVTGVLDYEAKTSFRFLVTATDSGDPRRTGSASLALDLKDVNDETPRFVEDSYAFVVVADRPVGSLLGRVKATDSDASELHRNVSYSVDALEMTFDVDPNTGQLRTREVLRQGQQFKFCVIASNVWSPIQLSSSTNVTVLVNGTLPSFLFPNPSNSSVTLDPGVVKVGDVIAEVKVDHDHGVTLRYEIVHGGGDKKRGFDIDVRTGRITLAAADLEKNLVYQLVLRVTDDLEPQNEVTARLSVHVTETSYGLLRLQTWLGSRERLMTIVGVVVGLALLVILVSIGAFVSLRVRRRKTFRGEYNCRYEASRVLKGRGGGGGGGGDPAGFAMADDVNQAGVLLTSGKLPRTPTKKKEVTFSLDEEVDDDEEDEALYKGNQNIYTRSGVKSCGDGLLNSPDDNESIGSDSGKGASEEGDSAVASRLPPRGHHPPPPHTHGRSESEGRDPSSSSSSSVAASVSGSNIKPVRITVPPQMLPHSRIPPPPPPSSSLDRPGQSVAMTTFKATPPQPSHTPQGLLSVESELTDHSVGGARSPLLPIPESTGSRSAHGAPFLDYATDV